MAIFKTYDPRVTTAGPGRLATSAVPTGGPSPDPGHIEAVMDPTTFAWMELTPNFWVGRGATNGGITISKGFQTTGLRHDLADSDVKSAVTAHSMTVTTNLTDTGDLLVMVEAWNLEGTITAITAGVTPPTVAARKTGIGTFNAVTHKSLALVEIDEEDLLRVFFLRDVTLNAGDVAMAITPGAFHEVPVSYIAYTDSGAATGYEFGEIIEMDGFGGIANS